MGTKETITESGWLMTSDIGRINPNGTLSIIDRKKNIFKTAFAEYIMTEMIEGAYSKACSVGQIWIYGNSFKNNILAVVSPDSTWAMGVLKEQGFWKSKAAIATQEFADEFNKIAPSTWRCLR